MAVASAAPGSIFCKQLLFSLLVSNNKRIKEFKHVTMCFLPPVWAWKRVGMGGESREDRLGEQKQIWEKFKEELRDLGPGMAGVLLAFQVPAAK